MDISIWAAIGFAFAAYAVVGNDALQTLGTFIGSNRHLHWTILFAFAALILLVTFTYGWHINGGDPSYGRLANEAKYPPIPIEWYHVLPPLVLVVITRLGIPVSTSFMVLTIFASVGGLGSMLEKSLIGYGAAFATGLGAYLILSGTVEKWFLRNPIDLPGTFSPYGAILVIGGGFFTLQYYVFNTIEAAHTYYVAMGVILALEIITTLVGLRARGAFYWVVLQWITTAYLWSIWLIQDFANIFVFLPRELTAFEGFTAMAVIMVLLAITFANRGGPVQRILQTKSAVTDIRSATIIDFFYATLLFAFKEVSNIPMSTTWVFLGLIAGREYGFAFMTRVIGMGRALIDTVEDVAKAYVGIVVSIDLAVGLPFIGALISQHATDVSEIFPSQRFAIFVLVANVTLVPVLFFAFSKPEDHPNQSKLRWAVVIASMLLILTALFFFFGIGAT
ncbi:hypothetical protein [Parvularcula sp. LCG005]|uniref:hypothetical protein n=1 Tax=Parvularcula sp. LCG005 TaxID=3078805 RepID=UPI0029424413|nr:hypothetical protein [Parvularcula sp. LCG005]WOI53276.1 hypothetical protein RUI03_14105 [Parvularcula sp. LCG005]